MRAPWIVLALACPAVQALPNPASPPRHPPRYTQATYRRHSLGAAARRVTMPRHSYRIAFDPNADKVTVQLDNAEELKPKVVEVRATLCSFAHLPRAGSAPRVCASVQVCVRPPGDQEGWI